MLYNAEHFAVILLILDNILPHTHNKYKDKMLFLFADDTYLVINGDYLDDL